MSLVAKRATISSLVFGTLEFGIQEWLKRDWRRNRPCTGEVLARGSVLVIAKEFSAKASAICVKGTQALSRRHRKCCFALGAKN